jgi:hypothetical protein
MIIPRKVAEQALDALHRASSYYNTYHEMDALREALEPQEPQEWADVPQEFHDWWDADRLTQTNPFREDSPAYWAWEGWQARTAAEPPTGLWRYDFAAPPECASLEAQSTELDRKLAELEAANRELLEAARRLCDSHKRLSGGVWDKARAAIKKAEREA